MKQEELRNYFLKYTRDPTIEENRELLSIFANFMLNAIYKHHDEPTSSIYEAEAKVVFQMMLTKLLNLKNLLNGVSFTSVQGYTLNNLFDPTVVAILIRNMFETTGLFTLIYRNAKTIDERTIIYKLWVISGLKYRQRFESAIISEENRAKYEKEGLEIQQLIKEIEETELYLSLDDKNKGRIQNRINKKEFLISFEGQTVNFLSYHDLVQIMGIRAGVFDNIYTFFSLYTHPSNVSVFQFGDMFQDDQCHAINMVNFNVRYAVYLLGFNISDYINIFPTVMEAYNELPIEQQVLLNYPNRFLRGDEYSINDSWKALG